MRIAAICALVCACGLWGNRRAARLSHRIGQILMAMDALRRLQGYMLHWKRELSGALISSGAKEGLGAVMQKAGQQMQADNDALPGRVLMDTLEGERTELLREMAEEEWAALAEFFSALTMMDGEQAKDRFAFVMERLGACLVQARAEKERKARLIRSLGWLILKV